MQLVRGLILTALCLLAAEVFSQQVSFRHLTIDDGLSQNAVFYILQDSQSFMWFGTKDGLNRYDGRNFVVYQHNPFDSMRGKMTGDGGRTTESPFEGGAEVPDGTEVGDVSSMEYKPKLSVRTHKTDKPVTIEIEDNEPGIPDDIKDKILQPFFTTKKGTQGSGLGLSITNEIVKAHVVTIIIKTKVEEENPDSFGKNESTTFTIELHV